MQVGWAELLVGTVRPAGIAAVRGCSNGLCRYACVIAVALGLSNQGVANQLNISLETVKTHVVNATGKLGAQGRTQLVVKAIVYGLIDPHG